MKRDRFEGNRMIYAVTGFGRCGTSLVMQMLAAGGMPIVCDAHTLGCSFESGVTMAPAQIREVHAHNWHGQAIKLLETGSRRPPKGHAYRFIWTKRDYADQALSQIKFVLKANAKVTDYPSITGLTKSLQRDTRRTLRLLRSYPHSKLMVVDFADLVTQPRVEAQRVVDFIGIDLDVDAMTGEAIPRTTGVYSGFLELDIMKRHEDRVAAIKAEGQTDGEETTAPA